MQVVHAEDAVDAEDVRPHLVQVDPARRGLQQHVERLAEEVPGPGQHEARR